MIVVSLSRGEIAAALLLLSLNWLRPGGVGRLIVAATTLLLRASASTSRPST